MLEQILTFYKKNRKQLTDTRNIALYVFTLIVLAIAWSTIKTIQSNYELQKQISVLKQQNDVLELENETTDLNNKYYQTDSYLDLAARQNLGLAAPGEKVLLVPKAVALKYAGENSSVNTRSATPVDSRAGYVKNLEDWRDFLMGRKLQG